MTYLVDANVLSEATKPAPDARVIAWLRENESEIVVDSIVLGEIRYGILVLPRGARRQRLERWFADGVRRIRCLAWDASAALRWAELLARLKAGGQSLPLRDGMIAASALRHKLTVATRNDGDFRRTGVKVMNPFE